MKKQWRAIRVVHSLGGVRLINKLEPTVEIIPYTNQDNANKFFIREYNQLFSKSESMNLPVIGVEFYTKESQLEGTDITEWRSFSPSIKDFWVNEDSARLWSFIAHAAHKQKNGKLWDLASRISYQLRVSAWRLKELSDSYHRQLVSTVERGAHEDGVAFIDGFTWVCYMSTQSYLVDVCILRDYLVEFASGYIFGKLLDEKDRNTTKIQKLIKSLKKAQCADALYHYIEDISVGRGWLKTLGAYRDLVVHSAPLAHAEKQLYAVCKNIKTQNTIIPSISCPMPDNPESISSSRARESIFEDFERQIELFRSTVSSDTEHVDALKYCHSSLVKISELAKIFSDRSPLKPEMPVLDKSNIIKIEFD